MMTRVPFSGWTPPMNTHILRHAIAIPTFVAAILTGSTAQAQTDAPHAGTVDLVTGKVRISNAAGAVLQPAKGAVVRPGDTIETDAAGELHVKMEDGGYLAIRPNTVLKIEHYVVNGDAGDSSTLNLLRGALRSLTGWIGKLNPKGYRITTPTATIGVRGTDHETIHIPVETAGPDEIPGTHDRVNAGATFLETVQGRIDIAEGRAGYAPLAAKDRPAGAPLLHAAIPKFMAERRTANDALTDRYRGEIDQHIRKRLRELRKSELDDRFEASDEKQRQARQQDNDRMAGEQNQNRNRQDTSEARPPQAGKAHKTHKPQKH